MNLQSGVGVGRPDDRVPLVPITGMSITMKGNLNNYGVEYFRKLFGACQCDPFWEFHSGDCPSFPGVKMIRSKSEQAAARYMEEVGLSPTPDAIQQMTDVFEHCLRIMCERPYDPHGKTWRKSGRFGILGDVRKKFERLWFFYWERNQEHPDSIFDMINFAGFLARSADTRFGEWGEPAGKAE